MLLFVLALVGIPVGVLAQQSAPRTDTTTADRHDVINDKEHHYIGKVEFDSGDTKLYADDVWYYVDQNRAVATGNVVFRQGTNQISADRAEFDTKTRLGTFYNASGFATAQPPRQAAAAPGGAALPPRTGEDTIVYFFGETVEKIGPKKYKISSGGFTTCVQPTPRWDLHADTVVLNIDHYTLLKNAVMNVKGVPLFYLPVLYYPTKKEDRATGFLLPTYGRSTLRGQQLHNAFFWAINRSQDATISHDWSSKTGQGAGTEYRYDFGGGSIGNLRAHLDQQTTADLTTIKSYQLNGTANQLLPGKMRAVARVDYFSDIRTNQALYTNIYDASSSRRNFGGNVVGAWGSYSMSSTIDHNEYFSSQTSSTLSGSLPRVTLTRNERPIPNTPLYVTASGEYANILSIGRTEAGETNQGLTRIDFSPQVRFPFKKWQWFTANSTLSWSDTYYSRSWDPATITPGANQGTTIIDDNLNRRFLTFQTQLTGPVFNRIWDTPGNGYAEKFKHTVEPFVNVMRTSLIDNYAQIVKTGNDFTFGGNTTFTYGIANRFYAKRKPAAGGQPAQAREIFTVDLRQTHYSQASAAQFDPQCATCNGAGVSSNFGPIGLNVRAQPTNGLNASANAEFDSKYGALRRIGVTGTYLFSTQVQSSLTWSKNRTLDSVTEQFTTQDQSINGSGTVRTRDNKYGAIYSFSYDIFHSTMIQQSTSGFYNAQCCGIAVQYQAFHYASNSITPIAADHRFFLSFTLAGLGNFSPFNGALSGVPR
jgi:LPS-assembly protein